ncbi:tyrosine-type recombinase/integrase [Terrarubrum flagellatum]|uniref:tyrosine-type recombinase/integrase n=1 Tax=Terrirubrum flagellatum TaxID=2895980 RepID=UPI0031456598
MTALKDPGRYADGGRLYLSIGKNGRKAWVFFYVLHKRQREMGLGSVADVPLAKARDLAAAARIELAAGRDPLEIKRAQRAIPTFGEMADEVLKVAIARTRNAKSKYQWTASLKEQAAILRPIRVDRVTTQDVLSVLKPLWETVPESASKLRGRIERVLDAASAKGHFAHANPARWSGHLSALLPRPQKLSRGHHKAIPFGEVPAFVLNLRQRPALAARLLEFVILTASRMGEATGAKWGEVDMAAKVWTVPAARMKMNREHRVPLVPRTLEILAALKGKRKEPQPTDLIFPGGKANKPMSNMACARLFKRMKVDTTTHGFRSSFRDWCGEATNFPREIAEAALAHHVGNEVERAYRRGDALEKRRRLMVAWAAFLTTAPKVTNVTGIESARAS